MGDRSRGNGAYPSLAVGLLSAATLAFEILLVRLFAIEQFYHFAYMAIGVAMLGFGASGTLVTLLRHESRLRLQGWFAPAAIATSATLLLAPIVANRIPFDVTQLAFDARQWVNLTFLYLFLALPFAFGGLAILIAIITGAERPGRVYGASFAGAGLGAALAVAVLWIVTPVRALALPAIIAAAGGLAATGFERARPPWRFTGMAIVVLSIGVKTL